MKKILSLGLVLVLSLSMLAGCGGNGGNKDNGNAQTDAPAGTQAAAGDETAAGGETAAQAGDKSYINFDEEPYEVVIELLNLGSNTDSVPAMEEAINAITVPAINVTVKLQVIHIADHATKTALWAAGGEKIDVYYVGTTVPFSQFVSDGLIIPMTDLLAERGATITEKAGDLLDAFTVNGEIYAVPQTLYSAAARGIDYNATMAEELGLTLPTEWNLDALTEIGHQIKAADPSKYLVAKNGSTDAGEIQFLMNMEMFSTGTGAYGVLLNPETDTKAVNLYKTDEFKKYCLTNIEWKENGFMPADQAVNGENAQDVYKSQMSFYQWVGVTPVEAINKQAATPFENAQASFSNAWYTSSGVQEKAWGISMTCERPEKAMDFINFIYESPEVANILNYGIEGKDYVFVDGSDKIITYPEGVDATNVGWARIFNLFGDDMEIYQMAPATEEFYTELKEFNDNAVSCATLGYTFDASSVSNQVAAVTNVVQEYVPSLVYGEIAEADLDAYLAEMNEKLDGAGIEEIIAENNAQIEAWLASK